MKQGSIGLTSVVLGMMILAPSAMAGTLVEFEGGIGVIPVSSAAGTQNADATFPNVNRNDVRGVAPGGQPWVIRRFDAKVKENGDIRAEGKGLILAGGNNIGTTGGVPTVFATLFCQVAAGPPPTFSSHNSPEATLEPDGDFKIRGTLSPTPPDPCTNPALLIRIAPASVGRWLAAGILKLEHDD